MIQLLMKNNRLRVLQPKTLEECHTKFLPIHQNQTWTWSLRIKLEIENAKNFCLKN